MAEHIIELGAGNNSLKKNLLSARSKFIGCRKQ